MILRMPMTESDRYEGINDGNIETYKNTPMLSLTKEELQNSTDGALKDENGNPKKVTVEINDFHLDATELPDLETVKQVFRDEREFWNNFLQNDKKAVRFFDNALKVLDQEKIRCIRISDFNTTGLTGIKGQSTPWRNLVKNKGVSDKETSATGSFGIGKDAAFACSELRAVFYNTINTDPEDNEAFEGVLKLPSYSLGEDKNYDGFGFFCKESDNRKTDPIMESTSLDPEYKRTETGMDKYIIGFPEDLSKEELKREIVASSISNFLYAFFEDKLCVKVEDIIVDREHLPEIFEQYADSIDQLTKEYYVTLTNPDLTQKVTTFEEDDVTIYVKLMPDASRKTAIIRQSGMKVFDKSHISGRIEFAAAVILTGQTANGYFKKLENPEHTGWAIDRASNKKEAKEKQDIIFKALRDIINQLHTENFEETMDADGMNDYLPMAYVTGKKKKVEGLSNEVEAKKKAPKQKKKKKATVSETETITYEEDEQGNIDETTVEIVPATTSGGGGGGGQHEGGGGERVLGGEEPVKLTENEFGKFISKKVIPNSSFRFILSQTGDIYHLKLTGEKSIKKGFAEIFISGEQEPVAAALKKAAIDGKDAEISGNKISFEHLEADVKHDISFSFRQQGSWAIEVKINEN